MLGDLGLTTKTTTTENADGTITKTTTKVKLDGSKVTRRQTVKPGSAAGGRGSRPVRAQGGGRGEKYFPKDTRGRGGGPSPLIHSSFGPSLAEMIQSVTDDCIKILGGQSHKDDEAFAMKASRAIPATINLIASQDDVTQAQESDKARLKYGLPKLPGTTCDSMSVVTAAFLQLLSENPQRVLAGSATNDGAPLDCRQALKEIQARVKKCSKIKQPNPVLSSSRPLGPPTTNDYKPFYVVPPGFTGTRRALLIAATRGESGNLKGPPNDVQQVHYFLTKYCGFLDKNIIILRDDQDAMKGKNCTNKSTKQNILDGFEKMVRQAQPGDAVFIQFSGHGGRMGNDLYILPSDYRKHGHIMDYDILRDLTKNLPAKVHATMLVDCCYSGCIGDLPYRLLSKQLADDPVQKIGSYYDTDTRQEMIDKQNAGGYHETLSARQRWRNVTRIATAAKEYAMEMAEEVKNTLQLGDASDHTASTKQSSLDNSSNHSSLLDGSLMDCWSNHSSGSGSRLGSGSLAPFPKPPPKKRVSAPTTSSSPKGSVTPPTRKSTGSLNPKRVPEEPTDLTAIPQSSYAKEDIRRQKEIAIKHSQDLSNHKKSPHTRGSGKKKTTSRSKTPPPQKRQSTPPRSVGTSPHRRRATSPARTFETYIG